MIRKVAKVYSIVNLEDLDKVDFSQVGETSKNTIRKNLLDPPTKFVLKWDDEPTFITDGSIVPDATYTHAECLEVMKTPEWSEQDPLL